MQRRLRPVLREQYVSRNASGECEDNAKSKIAAKSGIPGTAGADTQLKVTNSLDRDLPPRVVFLPNRCTGVYSAIDIDDLQRKRGGM